MTNGKHKGNRFENDLCKVLSLWVSTGRTNQLFDRSSNSGGKASRFAKAARSSKTTKDVYATGDIVAVHPDGTFLTDRLIIEAKTGYDKDIRLPSAFWRHDNLFWKFVSQAQRAAIDRFDNGWRWWLIFKQTRQPTYLFTSEHFTQLYIPSPKIDHCHVDNLTLGRLVMFDLDDVLNAYSCRTMFGAAA